jgi:hypothetical protein
MAGRGQGWCDSPPEERAGAEAVQQDDRAATMTVPIHVHRTRANWHAQNVSLHREINLRDGE